MQIPFYSVVGNHDYGVATTKGNYSVIPQFEYTFFDPWGQWYMPNRWYSVVPKTKQPIHISAIDT